MTETLTTALERAAEPNDRRVFAVSLDIVVYVAARSADEAEDMARSRVAWEDWHIWQVTGVREES